MFRRPVALVEHRLSARKGEPVHDEPERSAAGVSVDCLQRRHCGRTLLRTVKAFYSDLFVLPLPETHRFPMAKYSRLRERLGADGTVSTPEPHGPHAKRR